MSKKPARAPEQTRRKILKAAFGEFYRTGFQGGSLNRIVQGARTTKGALFHHFKDKNDLGYAVLEELIRPRIQALWIEPLAQSVDPVSDLKRCFRRFVVEEAEAGRLAQGCPLNNLAQEMSPLDEGFRLRIDALYKVWRGCLEDALARGIRAGRVREDVSPRNVAAFVVAAQTGMIGAAKNAQDEAVLRQAGEALFGYLDSLRP